MKQFAGFSHAALAAGMLAVASSNAFAAATVLGADASLDNFSFAADSLAGSQMVQPPPFLISTIPPVPGTLSSPGTLSATATAGDASATSSGNIDLALAALGGGGLGITGDVNSAATSLCGANCDQSEAANSTIVSMSLHLDSSMQFSLSGIFASTGGGSGFLTLAETFGATIFDIASPFDASTVLNSSGTLAAGDYTFTIDLFAGTSGAQNFDDFATADLSGLNFRLTTVPVPAALPMLMGGLALLGLVRRKA